MKIDCHMHVPWQGYDADRAVGHLDELGIDKACLLTWELVDGLSTDYQHLPAKAMWAACEKYPDRFIPFYAPDPRRPDAAEVLKAAIARGVKGFGECKVRVCIENPDLIELFRIAGDAGLPVLLHLQTVRRLTYNEWYLHDIDGLDRVLGMMPDVNFIGHGPAFWSAISGDDSVETPGWYPKGPVTPGGKLVEMLERHANLYCDLSATSGLNAISRDPDWGREFVVRYRERLLYGTDVFNRRHLDYLEGLELDEDTMTMIMGGNAQRLLNANLSS